MNKNNYARSIFKKSSTTFFISTLFFPRDKQNDVFDLYAFVRIFDNFVDTIPQQSDDYYSLKKHYYQSLASGHCENQIINNFINLQNHYKFDQPWIDAFFVSMEMDLKDYKYQHFSDTEKYMFGSAEVVGLMMVKILDLSEQSYLYAQLLGKAFQYMNMIRDIAEDQTFGRTYIPLDICLQYGLSDLSYITAQHNQTGFVKLIRQEITRYYSIVEEAEKGFKFIPNNYLVAIKTAVDLFNMTMNKIYKDPMIVYKTKVKPTKLQATAYGIKNYITHA